MSSYHLGELNHTHSSYSNYHLIDVNQCTTSDSTHDITHLFDHSSSVDSSSLPRTFSAGGHDAPESLLSGDLFHSTKNTLQPFLDLTSKVVPALELPLHILDVADTLHTLSKEVLHPHGEHPVENGICGTTRIVTELGVAGFSSAILMESTLLSAPYLAGACAASGPACLPAAGVGLTTAVSSASNAAMDLITTAGDNAEHACHNLFSTARQIGDNNL
jgi:hypothetical protein